MIKRLAGSMLLSVFMTALSIGALGAEQAKLVASVSSDRYHWSTCKVAQKIRKEDLVEFKTPEDAVAQGLVPCKKCNPPASSHPSD